MVFAQRDHSECTPKAFNNKARVNEAAQPRSATLGHDAPSHTNPEVG